MTQVSNTEEKEFRWAYSTSLLRKTTESSGMLGPLRPYTGVDQDTDRNTVQFVTTVFFHVPYLDGWALPCLALV